MCVLCQSRKDLHVHHLISHRLLNFIIPRGYKKFPETPFLLAITCKRCHIQGETGGQKEDCIHPDMAWALRNYRKTKGDSFKRVFARRDQKLNREITKPLWNHKWDSILLMHAVYSTLEMIKDGHPWPS